MGIRDDPRWIEYCENTDRPSLRGFVDWTSKQHVEESSQIHQHQQLTFEEETLIIEERRGK